MKEIFVDTGFWIARLNPRDNLHQAAVDWAKCCEQHPLVTTDSVLGELAAFFAGQGLQFRQAVADLTASIEDNPNVTLLPDAQETVRLARKLYRERLDKEYSLVDCHSMEVMKKRGISLVLANDHHFEQEGFTALMRQPLAKADRLLLGK